MIAASMQKRFGFTLIEFLILLAIIGVAMTILIPALCGNKMPDTGTIMRKRFEPSHTELVGKVLITVPDRWGIVVQEDGTEDEDGQYYIKLTKSVYDSLHVGDRWNRIKGKPESVLPEAE